MANNTVVLLGLFIFTFALLQIYRWVKGGILNGSSTKKDDGELYKLPPGSTGWPLIGETISWYQCMSNNLPQKFVEDRQSRYGDIFISHLFGKRVIVSVDPHFNKFVTQNEGRLFQARYPKSMADLFGKYGLFSVHGDLHRKLHGIAVNLLSSDKLRVDFMADIQTLVHNTLTTWQAKDHIFLETECHEMISNLMAKQLLDLPPSKETDEFALFFSNFAAAFLSVPIKIPGSTYSRGLKARNLLVSKICKTLEKRRRQRQGDEVVHNDLLTKLMAEESLSDEIIADFLVFVLFAGHDASSRSMALAIKFLTDCPTALQQLREEHEGIQTRKGNENLTWDDYKSMKFTQCVINETLRLSNIAPGLYRETMEDIKMKGFHIPKGWLVFCLLTGVHLDEKNYPAARTFHPWRWQTNDQVPSDTTLLVPFGGGPRLCPGSQLARLELALFLGHFVTRFRWEVLKADHISHFPFAHLVGGFPIRLYKRE
nr:cytochrome P450 720B31 [Ginkgo biloba]|eukprot:Gb_08057 [translate_table: standard]